MVWTCFKNEVRIIKNDFNMNVKEHAQDGDRYHDGNNGLVNMWHRRKEERAQQETEEEWKTEVDGEIWFPDDVGYIKWEMSWEDKYVVKYTLYRIMFKVKVSVLIVIHTLSRANRSCDELLITQIVSFDVTFV